MDMWHMRGNHHSLMDGGASGRAVGGGMRPAHVTPAWTGLHGVKKPKTIRLFGLRYTVAWKRRHDLCGSPDGGCFSGRADHGQQLITVAKDLGCGAMRETLLHEALHVIVRSMGLELDEKMVQALGSGMLAAIRDNPKPFRWLARGDSR